MGRLKLVSATELEKYLISLGFVLSRSKGSHFFYRHNDGRRTVIPHHSNKDLPRGTLRSILRQINVTVDDFNEYFL